MREPGCRAGIAGMLVMAIGLTGIGLMAIGLTGIGLMAIAMAGPIGKGVEAEPGSIIKGSW